MGRGQPVPINPALLKWARQRSRIPKEHAARHLGVTTEQLLAFESGEEPITLGRLRKCAALYRRSLAVFFLPEPPDEVDVPTDYRRLPDGSRAEHSPALVHFVREVRGRQAAAREIAAQLGQLEPHRVPYARSTEHTDAVADRLRKALGYTLEQQMDEPSPDAVFRALRRSAEDLGVLVFSHGDRALPVDEFRGLSLYDKHLPVVAVNSKDAYSARNFSLIHELAHLMLRREGACNMADGNRIEAFCNGVSAHLLVPSAALARQPEVEGRSQRDEWPTDDVAALAGRFGVSGAVIARRLRDLGRMAQDDFVPYLQRRGGGSGRTGQPSYYVLQKSRLGAPFIGLVVEGYNQAVVSVRELYDLLGVKPRKLDKLVELLR